MKCPLGRAYFSAPVLSFLKHSTKARACFSASSTAHPDQLALCDGLDTRLVWPIKSRSRFKSTNATSAPLSIKARLITSPKPLAPPVTMATFPSSEKEGSVRLAGCPAWPSSALLDGSSSLLGYSTRIDPSVLACDPSPSLFFRRDEVVVNPFLENENVVVRGLVGGVGYIAGRGDTNWRHLVIREACSISRRTSILYVLRRDLLLIIYSA